MINIVTATELLKGQEPTPGTVDEDTVFVEEPEPLPEPTSELNEYGTNGEGLGTYGELQGTSQDG